MTWSDYSRWVRGALAADYGSLRYDDAAMDFAQHTAGDEYDLRLRHEPGSPPLRIHATFTGMPD